MSYSKKIYKDTLPIIETCCDKCVNTDSDEYYSAALDVAKSIWEIMKSSVNFTPYPLRFLLNILITKKEDARKIICGIILDNFLLDLFKDPLEYGITADIILNENYSTLIDTVGDILRKLILGTKFTNYELHNNDTNKYIFEEQ